ncbi:Dfp1/Him1, central region-domain-containing protein [Hygrophoropsis aurantiaca]|uniref:Dfp1/Him1, central region-domain-containing protein n=1 Tax=Hygrophoropsis aurantiaca TaxID=72124 RepID=A0ACB8A4P5_9AGAM|nr:Dfp1/Him1, central region-domain-containing protein [Hygrophoropsis aurantiaca]
MASTLNRRALSTRPLPLQVPLELSPLKTSSRSISVSSKRARSPEPSGDLGLSTVKRPRAVPPSPAAIATRQVDADKRDKDHRRAIREAQKEEFRVKYTRAFASWVFYIDLDPYDSDSESVSLRETLAARVIQLGGRVEDFFSREITHLITDQPIISDAPTSNKENARKMRASVSRSSMLLKSPIKLRGRATDDAPQSLIQQALTLNIKIWTTAKLDNVLERCDVPAPASSSRQQGTPAAPSAQRSLTRLLASERLHGTTTERDPTQKRHDYRYFSKSSCFVLVEDIRQELATIHTFEYPLKKGRDGKEHGAWPVLHCHPKARGPFIEFDEKERRRWEKSQRAEADKEDERIQKVARELKRQSQVHMQSRKAGDLRRSVSMNNLHRQALNAGMEDFIDLDADFGDGQDSANASGYLASTSNGAYIAASGNSVGITSTTGTTSNLGGSLRTLELPSALRGRIQQQVVTSRKVSSAAASKDQSSHKHGIMGPPIGIPERPNGLLRKSRSTNTLRLPKRDEGSKPGYCESCRVKFEDFENHVRERKHRKFASDDSNYLQLDFVLSRVQRRTRQQLEEQERQWPATALDDSEASELLCSGHLLQSTTFNDEDEAMWDDELDAEGEVDLELP